LQQAAKLILILDARLGMYEPALVCYGAVAAYEDVVGDRLPEDLDFEHIGDDLLRFAIDVGVHEGDIVIARNDVPKRG
jgi:hypothetical protein